MMGNGNRWVDIDDPLSDSFASLLIYSDTWSQDENPLDPTEGLSVYVPAAAGVLMNYETEKYGGMAVRCVRDV
jgi:hypothetical protein